MVQECVKITLTSLHESAIQYTYDKISMFFIREYLHIISYIYYMEKRLIYALKCPITDRIHYVGKTEVGMTRPFQHLKESHNEKIREWVNDLSIINHKPVVFILEKVYESDDINEREYYWIQKCLNDGELLFNVTSVNPTVIKTGIDELLEDRSTNWVEELAGSVKQRRKELKVNQERISDASVVALTVVRKIEQGKTNYNFNKLLDVLNVLGLELKVVPKKIK